MKSVLITGGSEGIGRGLARRFKRQGAQVMVTGRDAGKLARAAAEEGFLTCCSDIGSPADREALARHVLATLPSLDVVVNNAGMQRRVPLATDVSPWAERQAEIDALLAGPAHLCHLLIPSLTQRKSVLVNVTSGGAFVPQVFAPLYSACKAALHSYTINLRHALATTPCRVVEIIPPAVQTRLGGGPAHGAPLDEFCDAVFAKLMDEAVIEIGFGPTEKILAASRTDLDAAFQANAQRYAVPQYPA